MQLKLIPNIQVNRPFEYKKIKLNQYNQTISYRICFVFAAKCMKLTIKLKPVRPVDLRIEL